jgi:hypothetical protein
MEKELEFTKAPRANLETWDGVTALIKYSTIGIVTALILLALFLL